MYIRILTLGGLAAMLIAASASGMTMHQVQLSENSSDETPAALMRARVKFQVDTLETTLTVSVTNDTQLVSTGYNISELYFNGTSDVTSLTLLSANGDDGNNLASWSFLVGPSNDTKPDGMGRFDWALLDGVNGDPPTVMPGETQVFVFSIACGGTCDASAFGTELSTNGNKQLVVAKFLSGPLDDSAWGGTADPNFVPEPGTAALLSLGLAGLALRRRRGCLG